MIAWLKWKLARDELAELDRWRIHCSEAQRWFAEFPEVAVALDHVQRAAAGDRTSLIHRVRDEMRRLVAKRLAKRRQPIVTEH